MQVRSSETLVQFTKAIWGDAGRTAHYVAAHHLVELRKDALAYITKQLSTAQPVTEYDVQQRLTKGMVTRGLSGTAPVVAAGVNTADPYYVPTAAKTQPIKRGDLIVISLAAKVDKPDGIYAAQTWVAVADNQVKDEYRKAFETATLARDHALSLITDRTICPVHEVVPLEKCSRIAARIPALVIAAQHRALRRRRNRTRLAPDGQRASVRFLDEGDHARVTSQATCGGGGDEGPLVAAERDAQGIIDRRRAGRRRGTA